MRIGKHEDPPAHVSELNTPPDHYIVTLRSDLPSCPSATFSSTCQQKYATRFMAGCFVAGQSASILQSSNERTLSAYYEHVDRSTSRLVCSRTRYLLSPHCPPKSSCSGFSSGQQLNAPRSRLSNSDSRSMRQIGYNRTKGLPLSRWAVQRL